MSSTAQSDASGGDVSTGDGSAGTATRRRGRGSGTGRASSGASTTPDAGAATSAPAAPPIRTAARAAADEAAGVAAASRAPLPAVPFANQHVVTCWGCNTRLGYTDLSLGLIACPKCGALTDSARAVAKREATLKANGIYRTQPLYRLFRIAPSVFTVAAVTAVIGVGLGVILPWFMERAQLQPPIRILHICLSAFLVLNVVFNAVVLFGTTAAFQPQPSEMKKPTPSTLAPNELAGTRYCSECTWHKPPGVHHCSTCGVCIEDMDHHCIFFDRCIGRRNHKAFLQFLGFTVTAMVYATGMSMWAASYVKLYNGITAFEMMDVVNGRNGKRMELFMRLFESKDLWICVTIILFAIVTFSAFALLGSLIVGQVRAFYVGASTVDLMREAETMSSAAHPSKGLTPMMRRLRQVFGGKHWLLWWIPSWPGRSATRSRAALEE